MNPTLFPHRLDQRRALELDLRVLFSYGAEGGFLRLLVAPLKRVRALFEVTQIIRCVVRQRGTPSRLP